MLRLIRTGKTDEVIKLTSLKIDKIFANVGLGLPKKFHFEKISDPERPSRVITLCISGFTSEADDKAIKLEETSELLR